MISTTGISSLALLVLAGAVSAGPPDGKSAEARFRKAGKSAAVTVLPTRLAGTNMPQVGEVVALMLEKGGMTNLETSKADFVPPKDADLAATAAALAAFVRANPIGTEFALYTEFQGTPGKGVSEVRAIVVDKAGEVAWKDAQKKGDADFDRVKPREPMQGCILVVERVRPVLGLGDPNKYAGPPGKIAQRWQKETGVPDKAEQAAIEERGKHFRNEAANSKLIIYPAHAGDTFSAESATRLAKLINEKSLAKTTPAAAGPKLEVPGNINEQKVLWGMAHAFRDHVRKNPPAADYVMYVDYLMGKDKAGTMKVGAVHFAICNKQGELVVVDFQNDHWPDFKAIDPKNVEDCEKLAARRLAGYCK
ncbi:MAG: hypothetical protein K1X57_18255 [Gemmataceae bacterium]|nr:hypothetical protein [Gemmataceae bacterium]